jgi:uncharacterized LabA/DUF88 family protein
MTFPGGVGNMSGNGDVALLVDWENLKYSLAQRGQRPNVAALRSAAERFGRIVYARSYADWQDINHRDEASALYMAGLEPVYVPTRRFHEGGETRVKDSVDVKLTADCIEASHQFPNIGTFVIVSGDHGFLHVVNTLRPRGKQVVVVGVSWTTARQLTESADVVLYYDLDVDKPLSELTPPGPGAGAAVPQKVAPQIAQAADTFTSQAGAAEPADKREVADVLQAALSVVREFREASRDLSVSSLGQEMQKRMAPLTYAQQVKGKLTVLVQALAANKLVKIATRDLQDYLYLPDEAMPAPIPQQVSQPAHFNPGEYMYSDLTPAQKDGVIRAISALQRNPHLDYLTFKRIQKCVGETLGKDEWGVHNLTNSMVSFGVLRASGRRRATADGGYTYEFDTFELDPEHEDVRRALA